MPTLISVVWHCQGLGGRLDVRLTKDELATTNIQVTLLDLLVESKMGNVEQPTSLKFNIRELSMIHN